MNQVEEFIQRRFPVDCNWINGNCYYFAVILNTRFQYGRIYYDPIDGHFLFRYCDNYYDWTGKKEYTQREADRFYEWEKLQKIDPLYAKRLVRDCII